MAMEKVTLKIVVLLKSVMMIQEVYGAQMEVIMCMKQTLNRHSGYSWLPLPHNMVLPVVFLRYIEEDFIL